MRLFNKIAIVGVGLIGGSIGLAAKKKRLASEIIGVCRRESSRRKALKFKTVTRATLNIKEALSDADLVIIASPVGKIINLAKICVKFMKRGAILTDVGSSKRRIVREIERLTGKKVYFIGAHPMAGSDKNGAENASADIFEGAILLMTKTRKTNQAALARLKDFWNSLGCKIMILSPEEHDRRASFASYLPHVVSYALSLSQTKDSVKLAAGSLRDTTRVASSDTALWKDIFLSAKPQVLRSIGVFSRNLKTLENAIKRKDEKKIKKFLKRAKVIRDVIKAPDPRPKL